MEVTNKAVMEALDGLPPVKSTLLTACGGSNPRSFMGLRREA